MGNLDAVSLLLYHPQTFVNYLDSYSESALQKAVIGQHLEIFEVLLRCPKTKIPEEFEGNRTALMKKSATCCLNTSFALLAAAWGDDFRAIRGLLQCPCAEINTVNQKGMTPIYIASLQGHLQSAQVLVNDRKLDVNKVRRTKGTTAFAIASEKGHFKIMQLLVNHKNIDVNVAWCKDNWGHHKSLSTVRSTQQSDPDNKNQCNIMNISMTQQFLSAAETGETAKIEAFVRSSGSNANFAPCDATKAFILASKNGHSEIVKVLLHHVPIDINLVDGNAKTALYLASENDYYDVALELLQHGKIDINMAEPISGKTPLYIASKMGHENLTSLLLTKSEIDVNKHTVERESPLMAASVGGYFGIVRLLLAQPKIDPNFIDFEGKNALMNAIIKGTAAHGKQKTIVEFLIHCPSIDMKHRDELGNTVQDYAKESNNSYAIQLALNSTYSLKQNGHTCCSHKVNDGLQIAAEEGDLFIVKSFLKCQVVDLNEGFKYEITPLYMASRENHTDVVQLLLADTRVDVNKVVNSEHALLAAAEREHTDILRFLLEHPDIDVNKVNKITRETALIIAAESGYLEIVRLLLKHPQIFVNNVDSYADSALQKAVQEGHTEVLKLMRLQYQLHGTHNLGGIQLNFLSWGI